MKTSEPRILTLRGALGWSQAAMGEFLGRSQAAVFNLEHGQRESRSATRMLDALESALSRGALTDGATPDEALRLIGLASKSTVTNAEAAA